jgi:hypothetical protein
VIRRAVVIACVASASLVVISIAQAGFNASAPAGGQAFSSATLSPPTALSGSCSNGVASLTWSATPSTFADGYEILRGTASGGPYAHLANVSGRTTTSYSGGVSGNAKLYYVVRATKQQWWSASTSQVVINPSNC